MYMVRKFVRYVSVKGVDSEAEIKIIGNFSNGLSSFLHYTTRFYSIQ